MLQTDVKTAIALSEANHEVNFILLCVGAVFLRVGYRGYADSGRIVLDKKFDEFALSANACGVPVGVYFESQATTTTEAKKEAQFVLKHIQRYNISYPVYIKIRYADFNGKHIGRLYKAELTKEKQTRIADAFCKVIERNGYEAGVYCDYDFFRRRTVIHRISKYKLWVGKHKTNAIPKIRDIDFDMWQYCSDGKVKGVLGMACINYINR